MPFNILVAIFHKVDPGRRPDSMNPHYVRPRRLIIQCFSIVAGAALLCIQPLFAESPAHCTVQETNYLGWKAEEMANPWVKLTIVPQLGGRLMQVTFGGHDFLFVNDQLKGQYLPPETTQHRWINYGGDKIWPMPEGSEDEQHWAGAGGEPLDNAPFQLQVLSHGGECKVRLTGPVDPQIGQQYIRDITIGANSPVISFHAVMKNVSGYPQTWSEQSVSQYNAASPGDASQFNPKFWGLTPANPASVYLNGYHVRTGTSTNPSYSISDGLFRLHWSNIGGEVWVDSPGGWLAVVDGSTGYTMVERNRFDPKAEYPGKATMLFFTTGQRSANGRGRAAPTPQANAPAPMYYMEAEVNSPMVELNPGESYAMDTAWYPARMGSDFKTTTYSGVVGTPVTAAATPAGLVLSGNFGVFYPGHLVAHYYNRGGEALGTAQLAPVTPLQPTQLQMTVQAPPETSRVSVHVVDAQGLDRGPLGEALVNPPPGRDGGS
ncbi:MAG: hypothetical protein ABI158_00300 [Edaphobacter sp.]